MWTQAEVLALRDMSARLGVDPRNLVKLMCHESGCSPAATNWIYERDQGGKIIGRHAGAVGLIQFEPDTLGWEGWHGSQEAFSAIPVAGQLPYVERYFKARQTAILAAGGGLGALYTATFLPAQVPHAGDMTYVLCGEHGPFASDYRSNVAFDVPDANGHRKGYINVLDMVNAAEGAYAKSATGQAIVAALDALDAPVAASPVEASLDVELGAEPATSG
jgi:hypothetical protein